MKWKIRINWARGRICSSNNGLINNSWLMRLCHMRRMMANTFIRHVRSRNARKKWLRRRKEGINAIHAINDMIHASLHICYLLK